MLGSGFMSGPSEQSAASSSHAPASVTGAVTERPGANIVTRGDTCGDITLGDNCSIIKD